MADDSAMSALTHGLAIVSGGGVSGIIIRALANGFLKRLDDIERTLKELVEKGDQRHEKLLERMVSVESQASAAHRRLDELAGAKRRR